MDKWIQFRAPIVSAEPMESDLGEKHKAQRLILSTGHSFIFGTKGVSGTFQYHLFNRQTEKLGLTLPIDWNEALELLILTKFPISWIYKLEYVKHYAKYLYRIQIDQEESKEV